MANLQKINGLPAGSGKHPFATGITDCEIQEARITNQVLLSGVNPKWPSNVEEANKLVFFLEYMEPTAATVIVRTWEDATNILSCGAGHECNFAVSPIRMIGGISLFGTVYYAKGFFILNSSWDWGMLP